MVALYNATTVTTCMHYLFTDPLVEVKSHTGPKRVLVLYMFAKLLPLIDTDKKVLIIYIPSKTCQIWGENRGI